MHTAAGIPTDADALPDLQSFGGRPHISNAADDLMPQHRWIARNPPLIIPHGEIGMAEPAMLHLDFNVIAIERAKLNLLADEGLFDARSNPGIDL